VCMCGTSQAWLALTLTPARPIGKIGGQCVVGQCGCLQCVSHKLNVHEAWTQHGRIHRSIGLCSFIRQLLSPRCRVPQPRNARVHAGTHQQPRQLCLPATWLCRCGADSTLLELDVTRQELQGPDRPACRHPPLRMACPLCQPDGLSEPARRPSVLPPLSLFDMPSQRVASCSTGIIPVSNGTATVYP
jgi:hypothetical protein